LTAFATRAHDLLILLLISTAAIRFGLPGFCHLLGHCCSALARNTSSQCGKRSFKVTRREHAEQEALRLPAREEFVQWSKKSREKYTSRKYGLVSSGSISKSNTKPLHERILVTLGPDQIHQFNHIPFVCQRVRNDDVIVASNRIQSDSHAELVGDLPRALHDVLARVIEHMRKERVRD
jgi:hypothetical protein